MFFRNIEKTVDKCFALSANVIKTIRKPEFSFLLQFWTLNRSPSMSDTSSLSFPHSGAMQRGPVVRVDAGTLRQRDHLSCSKPSCQHLYHYPLSPLYWAHIKSSTEKQKNKGCISIIQTAETDFFSPPHRAFFSCIFSVTAVRVRASC